MRKIKIIAILAVLILCMGVFAVSAETQPVQTPATEPGQVVPVQTQPAVTDPVVTQPADSDDVVTPTDATQPASGADNTNPTGATEPSATQATEPTTFVRPTEIQTEPNTYSDYVSPAPIYTPGNQDYQKNDWENIELDLTNKGNSAAGGSFLDIKNNTSTEDERNPLFLILAIVFWSLALSAITFLILFRPEKAAAGAKHGAKRGSTPKRKSEPKKKEKAPRYERKYSDDYNDGF